MNFQLSMASWLNIIPVGHNSGKLVSTLHWKRQDLGRTNGKAQQESWKACIFICIVYLRWTFIGSWVFPFQTGTVGSTTVHGNPVAPGTMCCLQGLNSTSKVPPICEKKVGSSQHFSLTRFFFQWNYVGNMVFHSWHRKPEGSSGNTISIHW